MHDLLEAGQPAGDLAMPVAWTMATRARAGQLAHSRWQADRAAEDAAYQREVSIRHRVLVGGWEVLILGRLDGYFEESGRPVIEEIKSTPLPTDRLDGTTTADFPDWTRQTQLYLHFLVCRGQDPVGRLVISSLYDGGWRLLHVDPDPELGAFLAARLAWIVARREARIRWLAIRRQGPIPFAHAAYRPGQETLVEQLRDGLGRGRQVLLRAPTGLGKTAAALHAALLVAAETGRRVFFATARTPQQRLALDTVRAMVARGLPIRAVVLRARDKVCLNEVVVCRADSCRYAAAYHDKVAAADLLETPWADSPVVADAVVALGRTHEVCPFALSMDLAAEADLVIGDYNYLFDPGARTSRLLSEGLDGWIAVVDEAHNLPERGMGYASPTLLAAVARAASDQLEDEPDAAPYADLARRAAEWLEQGFSSLGGEDLDAWGGDTLLAATHEALAIAPDKALRELVAGLSEEAEALALPYAVRRLERMRYASPQRALFAQRSPPIEPVEGEEEPTIPGIAPVGEDAWTALARALHRLKAALDRAGEETVVIWRRGADAGLSLLCRDPSGILGPVLSGLAGSLCMSGTLEPVEFYRDLMGLAPDRVESIRASSPFPPENLRVLIASSVTTAFKHRSRDREATAELITDLVSVVPGNVAVFFSSFALRDELLSSIELEGRPAIIQDRRMDEAARAEVIDTLSRGEGHVLFAVLGGIFSEGVDLPGAGLLAAVIIGPALPGVGLERSLLQAWYEERYGQGFRYAFLVPGLSKVVQAAGRVIRSAEDRGVIVLVDRRFLQYEYQAQFPEEWSPERATKPAALLANFWQMKLDAG